MQLQMKRYRLHLACFALLVGNAPALSLQEKANTVRVEIGPNVRVSDTETSHVEPYVAAHPNDPRNLIVVSSHNVKGKGIIAEAFFTTDAGKTWAVSPLPQLRESLFANKLKYALDVWVTYARDGVAYLSTLTDIRIRERSGDHPDGTVGVSWLQHEKSHGRTHCYQIYFAAFIDRGETFTRPYVITDKVSCPDSDANREVIGRWQRGGDYMGLAAAADASFHAVWIARDGAFQVYTARIEARKGI